MNQNMRVVHTPEGAFEFPQKKYWGKQTDGSFKLTDVPDEGLTPEQYNEAVSVGSNGFSDRYADGNGIPIRDNGSRELKQALELAVHQSEKVWNDPEFQEMLKLGRGEADITATSETSDTGPVKDFNGRYLALVKLVAETWGGARCLSLSRVLPKDFVHVWDNGVGNGWPYTSGHIASIEAMMRHEVNEKARTDLFLKTLADKQAKLDAAMAEAQRQYAHKTTGADDIESLNAKVARLEALLSNAKPAIAATNDAPVPAPVPALPGDPAEYGLEPADEAPAPAPESSPVAQYATPEDAAVAQKAALTNWLDRIRNGLR
jgi:hypothetical protein